MNATVESAGWISLPQYGVLCAKAREHGVDPARLEKHFNLRALDELQAEDFAEALVFIGKNSKENVAW